VIRRVFEYNVFQALPPHYFHAFLDERLLTCLGMTHYSSFIGREIIDFMMRGHRNIEAHLVPDFVIISAILSKISIETHRWHSILWNLNNSRVSDIWNAIFKFRLASRRNRSFLTLVSKECAILGAGNVSDTLISNT
jgi:hypothetical protein